MGIKEEVPESWKLHFAAGILMGTGYPCNKQAREIMDDVAKWLLNLAAEEKNLATE